MIDKGGTLMVLKYAEEHDIIAELETQLMEYGEKVETLEKEQRKHENALRLQVELEWEEEHKPHLSNAEKRQIVFETLCKDCVELQTILNELKDLRRENRKLRIEHGNELRAFKIIVAQNND
jgi:hypothetical protein